MDIEFLAFGPLPDVMNISKLPRSLRSISSRNRYLNRNRSHQLQSTPVAGRGIRIIQRPNGTIIEARPGRGGGDSVVGIVFRGEYNSGRLYKRSDAVKISNGATSGLYVRTTDQTTVTEQPWLGGGWTMLSKLLDQWL